MLDPESLDTTIKIVWNGMVLDVFVALSIMGSGVLSSFIVADCTKEEFKDYKSALRYYWYMCWRTNVMEWRERERSEEGRRKFDRKYDLTKYLA